MTVWSETMEQTYEYYEVDPNTWKDKKKIDNIKSSSINWDLDTDTLGSASLDIINMVGECYIRIYLITIQNGVKEKHPLGTFLVQTPSSSFDGKVNNVSMDAYTPLLELKENPVPLGYTLLKDDNIMEEAYAIVRDNVRCPVIKTESNQLLKSNFVSNVDDKYIVFVKDLIEQAKYRLALDKMGDILFAPIVDIEALQPKFTFNDDNSSILYPDMTLKHDLYGIPNVVEVLCSTGSTMMYATAINDDPNSPTSTVSRGRKIIYRVTDPGLPGYPTQQQIDEYATDLLKKLSSIEYTITFSHAYCDVGIGDCVRINYSKAGLEDIKAQIIRQNIKCDLGCTVNSTAVFTKKLWK